MINLQENLHQKGLRMTSQRKLVMSVLKQSATPLSAQSIHQRVLDQNKEIGLASVYRTLTLLTDLGLIRRVHDHEDCQGYVLASPGHHHHLVCRQCGRAVEFSGADDLSKFINLIEENTGFTIEEHLLQFYGVCPECQKRNN